jgi:RecQ family ATP-dependent DNA helicase
MDMFSEEEFQFEQDCNDYYVNTTFDFDEPISFVIEKNNNKSNDISEKSKSKLKKSTKLKVSKTNLIDELLDNVCTECNDEQYSDNDELDLNNLTIKNKKSKIKKNKICEDSNENSNENLIELKYKYDKILKKYWNFNNLKDAQFNIISEILIHKRDVCAILATGFGKSICYQLPHLIDNKNIIVISPLISLMNDQFTDLKNKKINVCIFNSEENYEVINKYKSEIYNGNGKIIYMTPEYALKSESFIKQIEDNLIMIAIDEAHAISTWGLDFRKSYTKLSIFKEWVPNIPILTLTATASARVRKDIVSMLGLQNPKLIQGDFDRPNLIIRVYKKRIDDKIPQEMLFFLEKYKNEYIIIYCNTRDKTDEITEKVSKLGIECGSYHAGMSDIDKNSVQQKFIKGELKCIIATVAFGMGINISKIRLVLHYNCPKNMESYYQEIGRAGRDGELSECVLFYSSKDFKTSRYFLQNMVNKEQQTYQEEQIRKIERYVYSNDCRRKLILENFEQHIESCTRCDNCINEKKKNETLVNYSREAYLVFSVVNKLDGKFGMSTYINILLGRKGKLKDHMLQYEEFSKGNPYGTEEFWKEFFRCLINGEYIKETHDGFYITLSLTEKGKDMKSKYFNKYYSINKFVEGFNSLEKSLIIEFPRIEYERKAPKKLKTSTK